LEVDLQRSSKPSVVARQRVEARRVPRAAEQAEAGCSPRPTRPRSWWELRDAETLGVLDQHHGRVRDVDANLDDGRRDEHVGVAGGKRAIAACFSRWAI